MGMVTGFLEIERKERPYEKVEARLKTWKEFIHPLPPAEVGKQAARCMNCGIPFCHNGCPVNNMIPDWNDLVAATAGATRSRTCTRPTTSPSSPAASAPRRARRPARSTSSTSR